MEKAFQSEAADREIVLLVVEDEAPIRSMVCEYLRDVGFRVIEARDADEAIMVFSSATPVDLVFTDVDMPGSIDGLRLALWIRECHPSVPVMVTSGVAELRDIYQGLRVLPKPYSPRILERQIRELLEEEAPG
jgi:DNA-binding response OmpR family regulator